MARRKAIKTGGAPKESVNGAPPKREYVITVGPAAEREIRKLARKWSKPQRKELRELIDSLKTKPRPRGVEKLEDADKIYRIKCGPGSDFRIVYQIRNKELLIILLKVSDRKEAYRDIFKVIKARIQSIEATLG